MKHFVTILLCVVIYNANAQSFNNEWIDYSKTYYKFKIGKTGLYRISQTELSAAGLANVPAEQFQLWRQGKEVPIFTTILSGVFSSNDYIEFWGEENDGKLDRDLYKKTSYQLSDRYSLETDTAAYFLTINIGVNARLNVVPNNAAGNTLSPLPFFMHTIRQDFKTQINKGKAVYYGLYVYSSSYDEGEGWSTNDISPADNFTGTFSANLNAVSSGPSASFTIGVAGNSKDGAGRVVRGFINGTKLTEKSLGSFDARIFTSTVPATGLAGGTANYSINYTSNSSFDRIVVSFVELKYPRKFDFDNAAQFKFALPANSSSTYIEVNNFNGGTSGAVLYDLTNNQRYNAIFAGGLYKFLLSPSATERNLVLLNEDVSNVLPIGSIIKRNFKNFSSIDNQGDYLFIASKYLSGSTALNDYKAFRSSAAGGNFNSQIVEAEELYDQFAFGINKHPLAIKNFLRFARKVFTVKPKFCLLAGKGMTYDEFRRNESNVYAEQLDQVPTFGYPASDVLLASENFDPIAATPIGRISVLNNQELALYLDKLKEYEAQQKFSSPVVADKLWMKNIAFVAGLNSGGLEATIDSYFDGYKNRIEDSSFGAKVTYFSNSTTGGITPAVNKKLIDLFTEGMSLFNYFGHSSAINFDYLIDDPSTFKNQKKYPVFLVNGCDAGDIFSFDIPRLTTITSLAEKFVMSPKTGAIAFVGSSHYGITNYLDALNTGFYQSLSKNGYGKTVMTNLTDAMQFLITRPYLDSMTKYLQAEEHILNGDPAIKINTHAKPDYAIEDADVKLEPNIISVAEAEFTIKVYLHNTGRYQGDSVNVSVKRTLPDGTNNILFNKRIKAFAYADSLILKVPIVANISKGENILSVAVDDLQQVDELNENYNVVEKKFQIIANDVIPVFPYDLSIVPSAPKIFYASTADPFLSSTDFYFELDTTLLFNSAFKYQTTLKSKGGLLEFNYPNALQQSTVYYWRVGVVLNGIMKWRSSSFVFIADQKGFNQSHFYQHAQSSTDRINLTGYNNWEFAVKENILRPRISVWGTATGLMSEFSLMLNGEFISKKFCGYRSVIVNVLEPNTLKPLYNQPIPSVINNDAKGGFMGSLTSCSDLNRINFEFSVADAASRQKLKAFLDWIPSNYYVIIRNNNSNEPDDNVSVWKGDINIYGAGNTLYDKIKNVGFTGIDKYNYNRAWVYIYKNNDASFTSVERFTDDNTDKVIVDVQLSSKDSIGSISSPKIGPAQKWNSVQWSGTGNSAYNLDQTSLEVYGLDVSGNGSLITTAKAGVNINLSGVSTTKYPFLQLKLKTNDGVSVQPYQLDYWRVRFTPLPEGALSPAIKFEYKDTVDAGEIVKVGIPFKNISTEQFDSLQTKLIVTDHSNQTHIFNLPKTKKIDIADTAYIMTEIDTKNLTGNNVIQLDVNPNYVQPEQTHFNNFFFRNLYVKPDNVNPLMDVTFDGTHILNNDIVSASPKIRIELKDNTKYLLLNDTSLVNVQLRYPNNSVRQFYYTNDTLKFNPATDSKNVATVDFSPYLKEDGDYQLIVKAKDKSGNLVAANDYTIAFKIMNKAMISDLFNYPNPFTTSTAFVFTLTGNEIPQNLRIQILTITGKVVKEITKEELGPIRIGKNITEYKWDGTDMYGQKLANGVYIYRVITNLNGNSLERLEMKDSHGDTIDTQKFFNKGYGKMYLMR